MTQEAISIISIMLGVVILTAWVMWLLLRKSGDDRTMQFDRDAAKEQLTRGVMRINELENENRLLKKVLHDLNEKGLVAAAELEDDLLQQDVHREGAPPTGTEVPPEIKTEDAVESTPPTSTKASPKLETTGAVEPVSPTSTKSSPDIETADVVEPVSPTVTEAPLDNGTPDTVRSAPSQRNKLPLDAVTAGTVEDSSPTRTKASPEIESADVVEPVSPAVTEASLDNGIPDALRGAPSRRNKLPLDNETTGTVEDLSPTSTKASPGIESADVVERVALKTTETPPDNGTPDTVRGVSSQRKKLFPKPELDPHHVKSAQHQLEIDALDREIPPAPKKPAPKPAAPPQPQKDNLTLIKGIGPKLESELNKIGITRFQQIASLNNYDLDKLNDTIGMIKGRIRHLKWREQAWVLAKGKTNSL